VLLRSGIFTSEQIQALARDYRHAGLEPAEVAMMAFAEKVTAHANNVTPDDIEELRRHGFSDTEILDIALTAAARCFFSKVLDGVGAAPDDAFMRLDENLRGALAVGRPFDGRTA
jgi:alkylhydroperoxidase family enzyme